MDRDLDRGITVGGKVLVKIGFTFFGSIDFGRDGKIFLLFKRDGVCRKRKWMVMIPR